MEMSTGKFSFDAIERALSGEKHWEQVQPTIQLAFTSLVETLKQHENLIKDLELQISNKPSRHEFKAEIAEKVSYQEFTEHSSHFSSLLDAKVILIEDKVSLSDVQKLISERVKYDEVKKLLETKASVKEINVEIDKVYLQVDKIYQEICESLARLPNINEIEYFNQELKVRPNITMVEEIVSKKIEVVNKVLKNKLEKNDLLKKADTSDLKSLINVLENKVDSDVIEKVFGKLEKLEKNEVFFKKRVEKQIKDLVDDVKKSIIEEIDSKMSRHIHEIDKYIHDLNKELRHIRENPPATLPEIDHLKIKINENAEWFEQELNEIKEQQRNLILNFRNDISIEKANSRDIALEKADELVNSVKMIEKEIRNFHREVNLIKSDLSGIKSADEKFNGVLSVKLKELTYTSQGNYEEIQILKEQMKEKAVAVEVEELIHEKNKAIVMNLCGIREEIQEKLKKIQTGALKKAKESTVQYLLEKGIDEELSFKADKSDLELCYNELKQVKVQQETTFSSFSAYHKSLISDISKDFNDKYNSLVVELREKAWSADIFKQIESKPNIEEINKALLSIQNEIDEKLPLIEFSQFTSENSVILNTLCAEICIGRWLWKSGDLKEKLVIWDEENTNTNPLLFVWEANRNFILIEEPGIYELSFAIFNGKSAEILVNGQNVFSCEGKIGEFCGISKSDFVIIPARSRVSLKFTGECGQGFISLKKL